MIISLDAIAMSLNALRDPNPVRFELNWRIWRLMQLRRINERKTLLLSEPNGLIDLSEIIYLNAKLDAVEMIYSERHTTERAG